MILSPVQHKVTRGKKSDWLSLYMILVVSFVARMIVNFAKSFMLTPLTISLYSNQEFIRLGAYAFILYISYMGTTNFFLRETTPVEHDVN